MNFDEMKAIVGGAISATMVNALVRAVNSLLEIGRSIGSAIRRALTGKKCSI